MDKHTVIKKEIYKNLTEKGFHMKMDKETHKEIEDEKLKKYMNAIVQTHMKNVKADLTGRKKEISKINEDGIEILDKKHFVGNESQVYGKEFMINKIKEVYG